MSRRDLLMALAALTLASAALTDDADAQVPPGFSNRPTFTADGLANVVFMGGTVDQLEAAALAAGSNGVWAQDGSGAFQVIVVGGPSFLKDGFRARFPSGLSVSAVTVTRPRAASAAPPVVAAPPSTAPSPAARPAVSNDLITDAGGECFPGARVADGKVVIAADTTGLSTVNDYRLRLVTGEDVTISVTLEANATIGFAGVQFFNSRSPPKDDVRWASTAPRLVLSLAGNRVQVEVRDSVGKPAFEYNGPRGTQPGPLTLSVQRTGDTLVVRVAGVEVARTKVVGPSPVVRSTSVRTL